MSQPTEQHPALILASRSPQRRAILERLGVPFRVVAPDVEELTSGDPGTVVLENAARKVRATQGDFVLGVDTEVVLDGRTFGKPADEQEAEAMLGRLAGRAHEVISGICLRRDGVERVSSARTLVRFRPLASDEIRWYLGTGEWRDRAGGYAIQGRGAALVDSIEGDYWNVVGLPVAELMRLCPGIATGA